MLKKIVALVPAAMIVCAAIASPASAETVIVKHGHGHYHPPMHHHGRTVIIRHH